MGRVMIQRGARLNADGKPLRTSAPTSAAPRRRQSGAPKHSALLLRHPGAGPGGQATARAGGRVAWLSAARGGKAAGGYSASAGSARCSEERPREHSLASLAGGRAAGTCRRLLESRVVSTRLMLEDDG